MALITRLSRLFSADLHAVLDRMEEPDIVLKQAIRDMQAAVAAAERRIQALQVRGRQIATARSRAAARIQETAGELTVCLDAGNDELARTVIQRKLEAERQAASLDAEAEDARHRLTEQQREVCARRRELEALRSQADAFEATAPEAGFAASPAVVSPEEVEVALLREKQQRAAS